MITALNIEDYTRSGIYGLTSLFRHNRLRVEHLYCDTAAVKSLSYEHYRGKIGWASIDRFVKSQRNRVLCSEKVELPEESCFTRYSSSALSRRMCENASIALLRAIKRRDVKVALVDISGDSVGLCESLTEYADPVYVVTKAAELYIAQAEYLLSEKGAALRVSRSAGCLKDADLIIAVSPLDAGLGCAGNCVILSAEKPIVRQSSPVIYDWFFELPKKYQEIKPEYLSDMYFASALYDLAGARELGSELFTRCGDGTVIHTRMSLTELLSRRMERRDKAGL